MQRNLRRLKNVPYPKTPKNVEEISDAFKKPEIMKEFGFNLRGTDRFYMDTIEISSSSMFTIFVSHQVVAMIEDNIPPNDRHYLMDATFDVVPVGLGYYQLLIIYIQFKNDVFPVAYILMCDKKTVSYEAIFQYINNNIYDMQPASFMTDFERGMGKALKQTFPQAKLNTCWYHYSAAIRKRFLSHHLSKLIADNSAARSIYKKMLSLPLLPAEYIVKGYELIKEEAKKNKLQKHFKKIFHYFEGFWLTLVSFS